MFCTAPGPPPCSTFSRARDRSAATRLRSSEFPAGLPELSPELSAVAAEAMKFLSEEGNLIAKNAHELAVWAAKELKAVVILENPRLSYLWPFIDGTLSGREPAWQDIIISQCLFGAPYKKDLVSDPRRGVRGTNYRQAPDDASLD